MKERHASPHWRNCQACAVAFVAIVCRLRDKRQGEYAINYLIEDELRYLWELGRFGHCPCAQSVPRAFIPEKTEDNEDGVYETFDVFWKRWIRDYRRNPSHLEVKKVTEI